MGEVELALPLGKLGIVLRLDGESIFVVKLAASRAVRVYLISMKALSISSQKFVGEVWETHANSKYRTKETPALNPNSARQNACWRVDYPRLARAPKSPRRVSS